MTTQSKLQNMTSNKINEMTTEGQKSSYSKMTEVKQKRQKQRTQMK